MIFASKEIFVVSGDTFYCYNLGWEWEEALLLIYIVSRGEDAAAKHPIIYGAASYNISVVLGLRNPVLECQVGYKKIQASVMANCFTSAPILLICKIELKIFTVAISQMCWKESDK